jgi:hypothetical protein
MSTNSITHLEMQCNESENEALEVLHQVIKHAQPFWILTFLDFGQRPELGSLERDMFVTQTDLQLLSTDYILFGP